jgi:tRNA(fMet)-specific endonuclease VapC
VSYLLDTTHVIDLLHDDPAVVQLLDTLSPNGVATSIITYLEAFQGTLRLQRSIPQVRFETLFDSLPVLPLTPAIAQRCARLREHLERQGKQPNRRAFDLIIAATALEHGLTLVTNNQQDFSDIPNLTLYQL